jgi:hypothetical protein
MIQVASNYLIVIILIITTSIVNIFLFLFKQLLKKQEFTTLLYCSQFYCLVHDFNVTEHQAPLSYRTFHD